MSKLFSKRLWLCILLYLYQSILDYNKAFLIEGFQSFQTTQVFFPDFRIAQMPALFVVLYILHRALVHGCIVRIFTGQKKLMKYYVIADIGIFLLALPVFAIHKLLPSTAFYTESASFGFMKLLDSPLLLLFFLPSYYVFVSLNSKKEEAREVK